ncbi:cyclohexanone 1,2-monooxygenase [Boeremia exigua]|uniref:cyclohexanone 1,2-monooxygenase n=1 Tax=Boeremia exigua TaxID=749465 RepID=UPI001E8CAC28|nr:cyclohexanone 1,2-monooxygenase [Boeremia exigua]KAH6620572.1 cyclohexanone 1,2-monooxygenase [Boeremia exigua]
MDTTRLPKDRIEALLKKYDQERDKRLKKEGASQYIDIRSEDVEALGKDPWIDYNDPRVKNPPLKDGDHVKVLITGAGINGLVFAGRLIEAGISNKEVVCVDAAGGFGGTWYYNRYPGVMCDVEGYCYVPFLEETGYRPRHKYSYGHEIRGQMERSADHFGIQGQFCTKTDSKIWDEDKKLWIVTMTRTVGEPSISETFTVTSEFVVIAGGPFSFPKIPQLPGWNDFRKKNHAFHSARWDYSYTGGTQEKPDLVKLRGKRVAIIGTGATAIQIVPELAKWAEHVYVVQRTPTYIGERNQTETDPENWANITREKGWQEKRRTAFDAYVSNSEGYGPDVINDGWTHTPAGSGFLGSKSKIVARDEIEQHIRELYELDFPRTELLRKRVDGIVKDEGTAEKLKPWYGSWCKRPSFHDHFLQAFNKPNVTLIDTDGKGLDGFTENGILFQGAEYEIDALVLATGFTFGMSLDPSEKLGATITGRNGLSMKEYWNSADSGSLLGLALPGFPNVFSYFGRGSGATWNLTSVIETKAALLASIITQAQKQAGPGQRVVIEVSKEGESQFGQEVAKRANWFSVMPVCTPGYFNGEGAATFQEPKTEEQVFNESKRMAWGAGPLDYKEMTKDYAARGDLKGFTVEVVA